MEDDESVGMRIRRYRRSRGLSLDQAAGLAGVSKPYLSRLERGERPIDSLALLSRLSSALGVPLSDLTGQSDMRRNRDHEYREARHGVTGVRLALLDPNGPPASDEEIIAAFEELNRIRHSCDLVRQAQVVPKLLRWTQQSAAKLGSVKAHAQVVLVSYAAMFLMRNLGQFDLAWMAAERMRQAAEETGEPTMLGFAAYAQAHALTPVGALQRAVDVAMEGAGISSAASPEQTAARGSCLLVSAATVASLGDVDGARARLNDAALLANRLDMPTVVAEHTSFATWNVAMHRVSVEVESSNPVEAIEAARPLINAPIKHRERMSYLWVDLGRAFSQMDRHREAIEAFRRAERSAPLRVRLSPVVRESVRDLLGRSHRRAGGAELRGLAERCGVLGDK